MIQRIKNNAFARNSLILFIGTMTANIIGYIFHFVIGRMVSVPVYGEVESLVSLIAVISVPSGALTMAATKFSAGAKADNDPVGSGEILSYLNKKILKYGLPFFVLTVLITPLVQNFLKIESIWPLILVWVMMFLSFFSAVTGGMLNGWQKFKESSWANIWGALVKLAAAIILVMLGFAAGGVISGFVLGALVAYSLMIYFLKFTRKNRPSAASYESKMKFDSIKKYLIPVLVGNLAITILSNADMILAKHNLGFDAAGQYGALTVISKIIFFGTSIIATVLFSMSAEEHHKNNQSTRTFWQAIALMTILGLGAIAVYALFPGFILFMLFGDKYQSVSPYLIWFAISVTIFSFVNLIFQYLMSVHKTRIAYYLLAVSILAVLAIDLFGHSISVIIGITAASQVVGVLAGAYLLLNKAKKPKYYERE